MASSTSTVAYIYKINYSDRKVEDAAKRDHPFLANLAREGGFTGHPTFNYAVRTGNPQSIGGGFATQQTNVATSKGSQLAASRFTKYGVVRMDGTSIRAAKGNKGAFLDLVTQETDGMIQEFGNRLAFDLYRDGTGNRGQRATGGLSGNIVTLTTADDARNFQRGMTVISDNTASGLSPGSGNTTVASVDEGAGTITLTSAAALLSFADADYLFVEGDPGTCMEGLALCTPLTAPAASESFRGIDRSVDATRLAGSRVNDTSTSIEENIGLAAVKVSQNGGRVTQCYLNPINAWAVARRLQGKVEYTAGGDATYGFEGLRISTPAGMVMVISDPDCPTNRGYLCNPASHYLKTLEAAPHIINEDGNYSLRVYNADSLEARAVAEGNYIQSEPRNFAVIAI